MKKIDWEEQETKSVIYNIRLGRYRLGTKNQENSLGRYQVCSLCYMEQKKKQEIIFSFEDWKEN